MPDDARTWARLLPDHRTLYLSLDEIEARAASDGSPAEGLLSTIRFAEQTFEHHPDKRALVHDLVRRAGIPHDDALGNELAKALVARGAFLHENPQLLEVLVEERTDD